MKAGDAIGTTCACCSRRAVESVQGPSAPLHEGSEKLIWGHRDLESAVVFRHGSGALTDMVEVGSYVVVEPQTVLTLPVDYQLGPDVIRRVGDRRFEYRLRVVKQSGIDNDTVLVRALLPEDARVVASSPQGLRDW